LNTKKKNELINPYGKLSKSPSKKKDLIQKYYNTNKFKNAG